MDSTATHPTLHPPQAHYACPHCGCPLDLSALALPPIAADHLVSPQLASPPPAAAPSAALARILGRWLDGLLPMTGALRQPEPGPGASARIGGLWPRWGRRAPLLLPLVLILLWLIVRAVGGIPAASADPHDGTTLLSLPTPTIAPIIGSPAAPLPERASLLAVVAQYNAADQQVAATLTLDPIRPLLDERGPLFARRSGEIMQRKQAVAPHATRLLRWAVGPITIDAAGTTATLVTQETWENQETGAVAPQTVTARVTYTLRRTSAHAPWRIYDSTSTIL